MTITVLWWLVPTIATLASFFGAFCWSTETSSDILYAELETMFNLILATVVSLVAWLIGGLVYVALL